MSLDFSPVKMSSSSRTTSSVFQMMTLSSNLDTKNRYDSSVLMNTRGEVFPRSDSTTYFLGFLGAMSRAGPGAVISLGNMSTHISILP